MHIVLNPNAPRAINNPEILFELAKTYSVDAAFMQANTSVCDNTIKTIDGVSVIIDRSGSQYLAKWREYYLMLSQFLGDNVQVMSSQFEGVTIHDSKNAESILRAEPCSGAEGFTFAIDQCIHDIVLIIGDTCINDEQPSNHGKSVIFWDDGVIDQKWYEFKHRLNWANVQVDQNNGSIMEQIRVIASAVFIQQLKLCDNIEYQLHDYGPR